MTLGHEQLKGREGLGHDIRTGTAQVTGGTYMTLGQEQLKGRIRDMNSSRDGRDVAMTLGHEQLKGREGLGHDIRT